MNTHDFFGTLSIAAGLAAFALYWRAIYRHETKPHLFTHLIWAILASIGALAQLSDGAGPGAWVSFSTALGCIVTAVWAYFSGEKNITRGDWLSLITSLITIPLWILTKDPLSAVIIVSLIDFVGCYPTLRKSWNKPFQESLLAWSCNVIKLSFSLLAMDHFTLITSLYPASFLVLNIGFIFISLIRRKQISRCE